MRPLTWLRVRLGWGRSFRQLAGWLGMTPAELSGFAPHYRRVAVPKKNGALRRLLVPDRATKELQRRVLRKVLQWLPVHPCATGFVRGRSILDNAAPHVGRAVVVRLDVVDFFPATRAERVMGYLQRIGWGRRAAAMLVRICCHEGGLPQGAPTSPALSNLVNLGLDAELEAFANRRRGRYTRYADDLTFSFPKDYPSRVRGVLRKARAALRRRGYTMHERRKVHIRRRHQRQVVTGLVVNQKVALPRETRRWLRAVAHRVGTGRSASISAEQLQGWLALLRMVRERS